MIRFVPPEVVTIKAGETVEELAREHGVPIDLLMAWNGINPGDPLAAGRTLLVFDLEEAPTIASVDDAAAQPSPGAAAVAPKKRRARAANTPVLKVEPTVLAGPEVVRPAPGKGVRIELPQGARVGQAGVLGSIDGMELGSGTDALADAAGNLEGRRAADGGPLLRSSNSLAGGGTAEGLDHVADTRVVGKQTLGPHAGNVNVKAPVLPRAAPKTCLKGPTEADLASDDGYVMAKGLNADQVRAGMGKVVRYTLQCIPRGTIGDFTVTVEVTVGCNGLVNDVWLANSGGMPTPVTNCISQTVAQASFSAHALPDGAVFQYPITYRF